MMAVISSSDTIAPVHARAWRIRRREEHVARPMSVSAPLVSMMVRESNLRGYLEAMREGRLAFITR